MQVYIYNKSADFGLVKTVAEERKKAARARPR